MSANQLFRFGGAMISTFALLASPAHAKDHGDKGKGNDHKSEKKESKEEAKADKRDDKAERKGDKDFDTKTIVRFADPDRTTIFKYFESNGDKVHGLPPGLAKRNKPLPPGWRDKLISGYRIGDDWWPSFTPVPYDWFPSLRRDPDTVLYSYGDRVVRVYEPRREIIDVIVIPTIHGDF